MCTCVCVWAAGFESVSEREPVSQTMLPIYSKDLFHPLYIATNPKQQTRSWMFRVILKKWQMECKAMSTVAGNVNLLPLCFFSVACVLHKTNIRVIWVEGTELLFVAETRLKSTDVKMLPHDNNTNWQETNTNNAHSVLRQINTPQHADIPQQD